MVASLAVRKKLVKEEVVVAQPRPYFNHESSPTPSTSSQTSSSSAGRGKRKSPEEETGSDREKKRKLMNRVAAQQSRDRKRLYMDNLEKEIKKLKTENATLKSTNLTIQEEKERLATENAILKNQTMAVKVEDSQSVNEISSSVTIEPAEFINEFPLQKGQVTLGLVLWLMHFLNILSPTNSQMSSLVSSKKFGRISVENLIQRHLQTSQRAATKKLLGKWWGPHQQSWSPSKNSFNLSQNLPPLPSPS